MFTIFLVCAIVGGVLLILQVIASFFGGDADLAGDIDVDFSIDVDADLPEDIADLGMISFRTLVAFSTFFGLGGMGALDSGWGNTVALIFAVGCGGVAFYLVAFLMKKLHDLQSSGNVDIKNAVGQSCKVYLPIPGELTKPGKVTVSVQGRLAEYAAVTRGPAIETNTPCRVIGVHGPDTLMVETIDKEGDMSHV